MKRLSSHQGFTLVELLVVLGIIGVISALALVRLQRARTSGNESSAIGSLRAVNAAEASYASSCGAAGYAQSLEDLAKPPPAAAQGFISPDLPRNGVLKSGYVVSLQADATASIVAPASRTCNGSVADAVSAYFADARPFTPGVSGYRTFATDARGTIYTRADGIAISPGMAGAVPLQ